MAAGLAASLPRRLALAGGLAAVTAGANALLARAAERANPPVGRFTDAAGERIHFLEQGSGPPLLYLHGAGAMIQEVMATGLVPMLASSHRVIVPDRPGFGHSTRRARPCTLAHQAAAMADVLRDLGGAPAVVVGHSWGALLAAGLAVLHPDAVRSLVLISGYYFPTRRADQSLGLLAAPVGGDAIRHTLGPALALTAARAVITKAFAPNSITDDFDRLYSRSLAARPSQLRALSEDASIMPAAASRLVEHYPSIRCPVAILAGEDDQVVNVRHSRRLAGLVPGARLQTFPGLGHMLPHFERRAVVEAVRQVSG